MSALPVLPIALREAIAAELERGRERLETMGTALCSDRALVAAHGEALQGLDRLGQELLAIAGLLRADDAAAAIARVPLNALRLSLEHAMRAGAG